MKSEISSRAICEYSSRVELLAFNIENDIDIYKLQNQYSNRNNYIDVGWIMNRNEACHNQLSAGVKAACCGFSGLLFEEELKQIQNQAAHHLDQIPLQQIGFFY